MENFEKLLGGMQLHPVADHYTIALLTVAIVIDLVASLFPMRGWLRNTALTLTILGALAAAASYWTGDMEADRIRDMVMSPEATQYFKGKISFLGHGALGYELMLVFAVLALWRLLTAMFSFMQGSRGLYLLAALIALGFLIYQGHTGGVLVYQYGVGTGPMAVGASPMATPAPAEPSSLGTVYVPPSTPAPEMMPTAAASPAPANGAAGTPSGGSASSPAAAGSPAASGTPAARGTSEANL